MSEIRRLTADEFARCGVALRDRNSSALPAAIVCFERAVDLEPDNAAYLYFLGNAYWRAGIYGRAFDALFRARKIDQEFHGIPHNLGLACCDMGDFDEAGRWFNEAKKLAPEAKDVALDRALTLLMAGDWIAGFREYEVRMAALPKLYPQIDIPLWNGEPLEGKKIYVFAEQGLGDIIQFSRYVFYVAGLGGKVIFDAPGDLLPLFQGWPEDITMRRRDRAVPIPGADYYAPLCSLARLFGTTTGNVPADPGLFRKIAAELEVDFPKPPLGVLKVGICWAGNPTHEQDRHRSIALEHFLPLASNPRVQLYAFQVGRRAADINIVGGSPLIYDLGSQLTDWRVTAAALLQMDLLISIDTAVAHLAGAMDVPTWLLLPPVADWRWLTHCNDTPWYPHMQLMRQIRGYHVRGWESLLEHVAADLLAWTSPPAAKPL